MRLAGALVVLAACGDPVVTIAPVYEYPVGDPDALPTGLDRLVLGVATAGADQDLASIGFAPGQQIELPGVRPDEALVVHLTGLVGGNSVAYGRTCAFAVTDDGADDPAPHLWFARNVKFGTLGAAPSARTGGTAIATHDGRAVLVAAAQASAGAAVDVFDPRQGQLAALATVQARAGALAARLGLGPAERILIVGGAVGGAPSPVVEALTVEPPRVERLADEPLLAREAATATALTDGRVVVIGGAVAGGALATAVTELALRGGAVEVRTGPARLAHPRAEHTATRLGDDVGAPVLVAGGTGAGGAVAIAELWKPLSGELADPQRFAPAMMVPRRRHVARLLPDGSVLLIGGVDATGQPVRTLERFSLDAGFEAAGELPAAAGVVDVSATTLPDGRILVAGGRAAPGGPPLDTATIARLDVIGDTVDVVATDRLAVARAGHQAALLCDGTVLVTGGTDEPSAAERYNPPAAGRR